VNLLATRPGRRLLFGCLYLSEGAPIGFIWWALPTILRASGWEVATITLMTSVLVLPWALKFLWSPLLDAVRTSPWSLRSWILAAQFLMGCSLLPLAFTGLSVDFGILFPLLLVHAIAGSTQDAAIDALAISSVPPVERGSINGWMQVGMLAGRSALGGGTLLMEQAWGQVATMLLLIGTIWFSSLLLLAAREVSSVGNKSPDPGGRWGSVVQGLRRAATQRAFRAGIAFALVAGAGFEAVGAVAGPYLVDRGWKEESVGVFFAIHAVFAMAAGALTGGAIADRWGARRAAGVALLLICTIVALVAAIDAVEASIDWTVGVLTLLYCCVGGFTASSYALFMGITDPRVGATQFSAFMGATNGCESLSAWAVGRMIPAVGYGVSFLTMGCLSLAALPLLRFLNPPSRGDGSLPLRSAADNGVRQAP
jgi:MFS family permease